MLVLSRKPMQRIQIGDTVVVTVLAIRSNRVRIGIDAPKETQVLRTELQDQVVEPSGSGARPTLTPMSRGRPLKGTS